MVAVAVMSEVDEAVAGGQYPSREVRQADAAVPASTNGRINGQFAKGWKGGPGNPFAARTQKLKSKLLKASTPEAIERIAKGLVADAEHPDPSIRIPSRKELFDRLFGKAAQPLIAAGEAGQQFVNLAVILADPRALEQAKLLAEHLAQADDDPKWVQNRPVVSHDVDKPTEEPEGETPPHP